MSRILLLYATREGQTEKIAERLAAHLRNAGATVVLVNATDEHATADLDLPEFDRLVFGASMHAGGLEAEIVRFIDAHSAEIGRLPRSLFVVLLSAANRDPAQRAEALEDARSKIARQLAVGFEDVELIAGALTYSRYSWPLKWLMQRISRQAGGDTDTSRDYEYTDWDQVAAYAERLCG
jgi:menaquinone-dependent protoporphyrinogen oxidase